MIKYIELKPKVYKGENKIMKKKIVLTAVVAVIASIVVAGGVMDNTLLELTNHQAIQTAAEYRH